MPKVGEKFGDVPHLFLEMRAPWRAPAVPAAKRCSYSLSVEPHPAALVITASKSSLRKDVEVCARERSRDIAHARHAPRARRSRFVRRERRLRSRSP